jgi:hypothetical protein
MAEFEHGRRAERARIHAILRLASGDAWSLAAALQLAFCSSATPETAAAVLENMRRLRAGHPPKGHPQHEPNSTTH